MIERQFEDGTAVAPSVVDALVWPAQTAAWLTSCPVGTESVAALAVIDPERIPHAARVDLLVAAGRVQAWLAGVEQRILATIAARMEEAGDPVDPSGRRWGAQEVAAALRLAGSTAETRLDTAAALHGPLAATGAALARGEISYLQAAAIVEETLSLDAAGQRAVEHRVLPDAAGTSVGELRRRLRRAVTTVAPETAEDEHRHGMRERRVTYRTYRDGMASIWALLPADQAQALWEALTAVADRDRDVPGPDGESRSRDHRRADALGQLAWTALGDPDLPRRHGARPTITVAVALSTLLGCDQQSGQLTGYGPIPASMARRIAADPDATWRRMIVDEMGRALDYGRSTYRPPADLRDFVINRDRRCVFPGCTRHAHDSDLDHHTDWVAGGHTNPENVGPLCPLHHRMKHEAGWTVRRDVDGNVHWTSPTGRTYTRQADPYPVDNWTEWNPDGGRDPATPPAPVTGSDDPPPF